MFGRLDSLASIAFLFLMWPGVISVVAQQAGSDSKPAQTPIQTSNVQLEKVDRGYADFPRGMTSFGATVLDGKVFVAGGKSGRAHHYARSYQNREIFSLDQKGKEWTTAGETLGLQGLALVAHEGKIIRVGGLEARNEEGEEHELRSIAAVKSYDPESKKWSKLPSMPHGRSSLDACVHKNKIYVVGGWTLSIDEDQEWASDMLVLDLAAEKPEWESIKAPFETRALAARAFKDKLFVIGGIDGKGPTKKVHVFDIAENSWSEGPKVPCEGNLKAFGCSAVSVAGHLLVSTYDGGIYRLNAQQSGWEKVHQLESGRFFHQMVPAGDSCFALVGGSHMKHGSRKEVEVYAVKSMQE